MLVSRHYDPYRTKHPTIKSHLAMWKVISVVVFAKGKRRKEKGMERQRGEGLSAYAERIRIMKKQKMLSIIDMIFT